VLIEGLPVIDGLPVTDGLPMTDFLSSFFGLISFGKNGVKAESLGPSGDRSYSY